MACFSEVFRVANGKEDCGRPVGQGELVAFGARTERETNNIMCCCLHSAAVLS